MTEKRKIQAHLADEFRYPIRDPLWRHIYLSRGLKSIVSNERFQKLSGIRQLGPTHLVYPGATHTRFSHSLGVFELAKRTLCALLPYESTDFLSLDGVRSFLCAALLHDLGHFPYAHSLKELPLADHEALTGEFIRESELASLIRTEVGADPEFVTAIIDLSIPVRNEELALYRRILSGVLDPDKLDYLNRDAYFCGVPYGIQDIDFVLSKLLFDRRTGLYISFDGITAVENVLFSKYLMYRTVYWHRSVRAATAMIKNAVYTAMTEERIHAHDLYGLDDEDFTRTFTDSKYPPFRLIADVSSRRLYPLVREFPAGELLPAVADIASDLAARSRLEAAIAEETASHSRRPVEPNRIIIDIPEPISFESDLTIDTGTGCRPFPESGTVFNRTVVADFARSLRKIRVFVHPSLSDIPGLSDSLGSMLTAR
jgi:uncharacterized protein